MLARFSNVRFMAAGAWEIDGRSFRFLDLYDPAGQQPSVRFGVHQDVELPADLDFGDLLDLVCEISNETKVIRGTDRSIVRSKVVVQEAKLARPVANGQGDPAAAKAAAKGAVANAA